jgi:5-methylcytosine-specific restriction endonuclease McrA
MMTTIRNITGSPVLVLNQNYEPINVTNARRALTLVLSSKAEVLEIGQERLNSPSTSVECPSVIRLQYMVRRPFRRIPLTRREVFLRDDYTCQYCGHRTRDLTLDHVVPRSKGGAHTWDNLVSACSPCNHKKGRRTVEQARMHLRSLPREPRPSVYTIVRRFAPNGELVEGWQMYLPG